MHTEDSSESPCPVSPLVWVKSGEDTGCLLSSSIVARPRTSGGGPLERRVPVSGGEEWTIDRLTTSSSHRLLTPLRQPLRGRENYLRLLSSLTFFFFLYTGVRFTLDVSQGSQGSGHHETPRSVSLPPTPYLSGENSKISVPQFRTLTPTPSRTEPKSLPISGELPGTNPIRDRVTSL